MYRSVHPTTRDSLESLGLGAKQPYPMFDCGRVRSPLVQVVQPKKAMVRLGSQTTCSKGADGAWWPGPSVAGCSPDDGSGPLTKERGAVCTPGPVWLLLGLGRECRGSFLAGESETLEPWDGPKWERRCRWPVPLPLLCCPWWWTDGPLAGRPSGGILGEACDENNG